jgi:hypothetical protein
MEKIKYPLTALILCFICVLACKKTETEPPSIAPKGQVEIYLTDDPAPYTSVNVNISGLEYNKVSDPAAVAGWDTLPLKTRGVLDLLTIQNGTTTSLINTSLSELTIRQLKMRFANNGNTVTVNGIVYPLIIPSSILENGVVMPVNYDIQANQTKTIWIDFNVATSIKYDSIAKTYTLLPSLRTFDPLKSGRILGNALPQDAQAIVRVVKDSSNFTAICYPDYTRDGFFSVVGLDSGAYKVYITPTNPKYRSRTMVVPHIYSTNHTFNLGTINLTQLPFVASGEFKGEWFVNESVSTIYPAELVSVDSFYAPTININDSVFAIVQTFRTPDPIWVSSWPNSNADTLNFTPLVNGNILRNNIQGDIGTYSTNKDTFNIKYGFGVGNLAYLVNQKWVRRK